MQLKRKSLPLVIASDVIDPVVGEYRISDLPSAASLLGYGINKAMRDNMLQLRIAGEPQDKTCTMQFYGPKEFPSDYSDAKERRWWDMHAPGFEEYPFLFQCVVSAMTFDTATPASGRIVARRKKRDVVLQVKLLSLFAIEITWPPEECGDR